MKQRTTSPRTSVFALALAAATAGGPLGLMAVSGGIAAAATLPAMSPGAVVALQGTPDLWVADDQGVLHLAGDTRAISGKTVNWSAMTDVSLDQLQSAPVGSPGLSLPLVKVGDAIYLPKWETTAPAPTLYHVASAADLSLLGVNADDYGATVLDQATWEQQSGLAVTTLQKADLPPIVTPAGQPASSATTTMPQTTGTGTAPVPAGGAGSLNHTPTMGTDLTFTFPMGRGWSDGSAVPGLSSVLVQNALPGEQIFGTSRVLDAPPNGAYVYLVTSAISLGQHPDILTASDLANAAVRQICQSPDGCQTISGLTTGAIGSQTAAMTDFHVDRNLGQDVVLSGITNESGSSDSASTVDLYSHAAFVIHGNYGYEFRMTSTDPSALSSRMGDFDQALGTLAFAY
jgi:hypothetical protein